MIIRVRTNVGVWRIDGLDETEARARDVLEGIRRTRPNVVVEKPLSFDARCESPVDEHETLRAQNLRHGAMVHCRVDPASCVEATSEATTASSSANVRRVVDKDGSIKLVAAAGADDGRGFRKGMLALRDMKMHWTLNEFMEMDDQFTFKIKRQKESWIDAKGGLSVERSAATDFQRLLSTSRFRRRRFGLLYGTVENDDAFPNTEEEDDKREKRDDDLNARVRVEFVYEPPQEVDPDAPDGFVALEDPDEDRVERLAELLGLRRVGWIYGHPPRKGHVMSASEIVMAAELQLEAADGVRPTPFVTIKVTTTDDGTNAVSFEAFQVSRQCMEMVSEQALEVDPDDPTACVVNETFSAVVEAKNVKKVENDFFLTLVPIVQHANDQYVYQFPKTNREDYGERQSAEEMKRQLSKSGSQGWDFIDLLSDFHLLHFLSRSLDDSDLPTICASVKDRNVPLSDGYKIIIASMAGMDGAY